MNIKRSGKGYYSDEFFKIIKELKKRKELCEFLIERFKSSTIEYLWLKEININRQTLINILDYLEQIIKKYNEINILGDQIFSIGLELDQPINNIDNEFYKKAGEKYYKKFAKILDNELKNNNN